MAGLSKEELNIASNLDYPLNSNEYKDHARMIVRTIREAVLITGTLMRDKTLPIETRLKSFEFLADELFVLLPPSVGWLEIGGVKFCRGPRPQVDVSFGISPI